MNPSERILQVINAALVAKCNVRNQAVQGWGIVLKQPNDSQGELEDTTISERLAALNKQVDLLKQLLLDKNVPAKLYEKHLLAIKDAISPVKLTSQWQGIRDTFSPEIIASLNWASWALGKLEESISSEELKELVRSLNELEVLVAEPGLPDALRNLIKRSMQEIWEALELYPINGSDNLEDAINHIAGSFMFNKDAVYEAKNSNNSNIREICSKYLSVLRKTVSTFNSTITTGENTIKLGNVMSDLLEQANP